MTVENYNTHEAINQNFTNPLDPNNLVTRAEEIYNQQKSGGNISDAARKAQLVAEAEAAQQVKNLKMVEDLKNALIR